MAIVGGQYNFVIMNVNGLIKLVGTAHIVNMKNAELQGVKFMMTQSRAILFPIKPYTIKNNMNDQTKSVCETCKWWSEQIARELCANPRECYCINPKSKGFGRYHAGDHACVEYEKGRPVDEKI